MMGSLFTDFLEMLEEKLGFYTAEEVINQAGLKNGGAFTAVGYYTRQEMDQLVQSLSEKIGCSNEQVYYHFGVYLPARMTKRFPGFYASTPNLFLFLQKIGGLLEADTAKLYPREQAPLLSANIVNADKIEFLYDSKNCLGSMIEGCIVGHARYYNEEVKITRSELSEDGSKVLFVVERK